MSGWELKGFITVIKAGKNMQTANRKPGRPKGRLSESNFRKKAIRLLQESVCDETLPKAFRAEAALQLLLLEETKP